MGKNQFARLLKYYLALNDKTQSDMVKDLGYDKSTVSGWCSGSRVPKLDVIIDIADYLHVAPGDLIIENDEDSYYLNDYVRDLALFLFENPEYKVLLDASRKISREDIDTVKTIMERFERKD